MSTMQRWFAPASLLLVMVGAAGCGSRCEKGFARQDGVCLAFDVDGGARDSGVVTQADSGAGPQDAGMEVVDGGMSADTGPQMDAGAPEDAGPRPDSGMSMGGDPGRILVRGAAVLPMVDGQVFAPGEVYSEMGRIACVGPVGACAMEAEGATVVETDGVVLPGLVDAHNHVAYDFLPEWMTPRVFEDSGQWRDNADYELFVEPYSANKNDRDRFCAMVQWGEIMSLVNGTTTVFGTPQPRTCFRWLVRNAELSTGYNGFAADRMRTNTLGIDTVDAAAASALIADMDAGDVTAYVIHLAEGLSARARGEFLELQTLGLLREEAVLIHATALTAEDFAEVAAVGAKVVWSPSSNMALYQDTTNVQAALQAGVTVSIAPDWTPSGADNVLDEVRFARELADARWPGLFSAADLVAMITRIPAEQLGLGREIGKLEVGLHADLLVVDGDGVAPYESVLAATPADVQLVMIGGVPQYGTPALMDLIPDSPAACHDIDACGVGKRGCWEDTPDGPVSPSSITQVIEQFYPGGPEPLLDCP